MSKCRQLLISFCMMIPLIAWAAVPTWTIVRSQSSIKFTAVQNGAPVSGEFKKFSGEIQADPDQPNASSVKIVVDMASISDPYNQIEDTLKSADWFNIKLFPQAIFQSTGFTRTGNKTYQGKGTLTIRDKTMPITLKFVQEEYTKTKARIKGNAIVKRMAFGVGQGEWADTNAIKNDVRVDFIITAVKK